MKLRSDAKRLLRHYFSLCMNMAGTAPDEDNLAEIDSIVDLLCDGVKQEIQYESQRHLATIPLQVMCPVCTTVMLHKENMMYCNNAGCELYDIDFKLPTVPLEPVDASKKMSDMLLAFFSKEIRIRRSNYRTPSTPVFITFDGPSARLLDKIWGTDWFPESEYDEVLAEVSEEGYNLCVVGDD
jgi:hypothetical protein